MDLFERIKAVVGDANVITDKADMTPYLIEWRDLYRGETPMVVRPANTAEVSQILKLCFEAGQPVVPQGGNTSLVGGSIPFEKGEEIVLSLGRMNRVRAVDPLNDTLTVEAGCVLANVQATAEEADRVFPLRIGSEGSCMIGGNLSTNAGGVQVLHYGNAREQVLGLEVVLPDGRVWDGLRGLRKDNTGYDLKQLFIGAEGTLGVITAAVLKLYPRPAETQVALAAVRDVEAAIELLSMTRKMSGDRATAFELIPRIGLDLVRAHVPDMTDPMPAVYDWHVLVELSGGENSNLKDMLEGILEAGMEGGLVLDAVIAASDAQAANLWKFREEMSGAQKPEGGSIKHDISVPVSKIAEFIKRADAAVEKIVPGFRSVPFGHIGDGNVHYNPLQPVGMERQAFLDMWDEVSKAVHDIAHGLGGSISAEHGLGRMKREEIKRYKSEVEMDLMRAIKKTLDPKGIMNPGKLV